MTLGSAASQTRPERVAPLSLFPPDVQSWQPTPMAWRAPPGRSAAPVAAMGPPRTRVLLMADSALIALDLQRALREAGYRIVGPASSPGQAKRLLTHFSIDCAIIDLDGLDGDTASAAIDLLEQWSIPLVISTGRTEPHAAPAHRPLLRKPFAREDVVTAVEQAIAEQRGGGVPHPAAPPAHWPRLMPQL